jgi:regulator of protease activity HflC (stomatin/prohibitin superfamily)
MNIWLLIGVTVGLGIFFAGIRIIPPTHRGLVERLGTYHHFGQPGFNWLIPVIDTLHLVNVTEQMFDADSQQIITNDNLNAQVDAQIYFKVKSLEEDVMPRQIIPSRFKARV